MSRRLKEPTITTRVMDSLVRCDDLLTARQLRERYLPDVRPARIATALIELRHFKAVDCVEQPDRLWWYATPESDTRTRVIHERCPETKPRRSRRKKNVTRSKKA